MENHSNKKCKGCSAAVGQPCQKALDRIRAIQIGNIKKEDTSKITVGCDWFVNSAEYNYSFHNMLSDLDGSPLSDKEICKLLMITQVELKAIFNSAMEKLRQPENAHLVQELLEIVSERSSDVDNSVFVPLEFGDAITRSNYEGTEDLEENGESNKKGKRGPKPKNKKPLHGLGLPLHHTGKKVDIHFGYSPARYQEIEENKKRIKKVKKNEESD